MAAAVAGLFAGVLFGIGLMLGGMTQPAKVLAFLDVTGDWDASLAFVMGGAIAVYAPMYRYLVKARVPAYARAFVLPNRTDLDPPLLIGAGLFGIGWGIAGFCPGPGLVSAGTGQAPGLVFAVSMLLGMFLHQGYQRVRSTSGRGKPVQDGNDTGAQTPARGGA